jgi:hypothetical protein
MLKQLWELWKLYLVLGIAGDDPPADDPPADEPPADDPPADELPADDLDSLIETVEAGGDDKDDKPPSRENAAIRDARKRAQDAEEARIRAEATLEAERRMRQPQAYSDDQRLYDQEEARLRADDATDLEKWQIRSNRTLRANTQAANRALTSAADMQDKSAFDRLEISNPKVYKLYADKVEKALGEMRGRGQDAPRLALLRFMIGNDVMEGKLKSGTGKKASTTTSETRSTIDRGRSPGARSDVSGKGRMSEQEKRRERLKGVII